MLAEEALTRADAARRQGDEEQRLSAAIAAYAYARTGYHRGLDALRRSGWKGHGPVPWSHGPNQGFLRSVRALAGAAEHVGEADEVTRLGGLLRRRRPDPRLSAGPTHRGPVPVGRPGREAEGPRPLERRGPRRSRTPSGLPADRPHGRCGTSATPGPQSVPVTDTLHYRVTRPGRGAGAGVPGGPRRCGAGAASQTGPVTADASPTAASSSSAAGISGLACARRAAEAAGLASGSWTAAGGWGAGWRRGPWTRSSVGTSSTPGPRTSRSATTTSPPSCRTGSARGLVREWTDTFHLSDGEGLVGTKVGPVRFAGTGGLRSLVEDLAAGLQVDHPREVAEVQPLPGEGPGTPAGVLVDGDRYDAVVLAMPDPQAYDLLPEDVARRLLDEPPSDWRPVIAVYAAWTKRDWPELDGVFVDGSPVVDWVADDGRRRGDDAPVLVVHTTPVFAASRLDDPASAVPHVLAELDRVLGVELEEPEWARAHRWSLASPSRQRPAPQFALSEDGTVGVCGDAWGERPRIEAAWLSGDRLGGALAGAVRGRRLSTLH